ncbi:hypothetical protein B808_384 [Fructilactobacillus florum 8D]|uniref:P-type ATPase A domain-containing protein n=1 Tax=Fructilactobacillus florum 8D TaxID=1221538 RepID=W9EF67_9LACO|nr:HAD-IC family P-type ATPase [Fructilactobacillus florum]ETO40722.1 hypothetical protein B808_384 [Fructilactobacillus florum 8D]
MSDQHYSGLSSAEVAAKVAAGQKNTPPPALTKTVGQIVVSNVFNLFNFINLVLGLLVFTTGSYKNLLFLLIAFLNSLIGIIQEVRSKRQVDKMALLSQAHSRVVRDGETVEIPSEQLVLDDVIQLTLGDQIPVDGVILATKELEVDESQITGESNPINKPNGASVISGSFVVGGHAVMQATKVGDDTFVNSLTAKAKTTSRKKSVLLDLINKIIRILTVIIIPLGLALFTSRILRGVSWNDAILGTVAAMIGMIPEGLVLLSSVTLAVSAYRLARRKVLVRDLASIETLARVDTLCLDKTGTITSGELKFDRLEQLATGTTTATIAPLLGSVLREVGDTNATAMALQKEFMQANQVASRIIPFSSARKWSGAQLADGKNYVLGAPQFVLQMSSNESNQVHELATQGLRVLAFATAETMTETSLSKTKLIAFVILSDVIRSDAPETLRYFANQGVTLRLISGDDPTTVASIASRVGVTQADQYVDMSTVKTPNYPKLVAHNRVFGRVKPEQKEQLIRAMQQAGKTVAMTGDGVNDILALKQADCGIAMATGNESTKSIADFVLINSNFSAMVNVLKEGRRVINNIDNIASLYLIKTMFSVILSVIFLFLARNYPFQPIQLTPINSLMVGVPSFFLAMAPEFHPIRNRFVSGIIAIAIPSALCVVVDVLLLGGLGPFLGLSAPSIASLNVLVTGFVCWQAMLLISRPWNRYKLMVVSISITLFLAVFIFLGPLFSLTGLNNWVALLVGAVMILLINPMFLLLQRVVNWSWQRLTIWRSALKK